MAPRSKKSVRNARYARGSGGRRDESPKSRFRRSGRTKRKGRCKPKLKRWLKTPQDWARFDAWAKVNAQPRQYPEPEPVTRPVKPLHLLKRRIKMLARPNDRPDPRCLCRPLDYKVSKAALRAKPSRRTLLLALPKIKLCDYGRIYYQVPPGALTYEASERIRELSKPRNFLSEECKPPRLSMCEAQGMDEETLRRLALAKKMVDCPEQLTSEEIEELFTPNGIKRTALTYKMTPRLNNLALPKDKPRKPGRKC